MLNAASEAVLEAVGEITAGGELATAPMIGIRARPPLETDEAGVIAELLRRERYLDADQTEGGVCHLTVSDRGHLYLGELRLSAGHAEAPIGLIIGQGPPPQQLAG